MLEFISFEKMLVKHIFIWVVIPFAIYVFSNSNSATGQPENSAPEVRIIRPPDQSTFHWNSFVPYTIAISDQEDGKSEYEEINNQEVLLEVRFFSDVSALAKFPAENTKRTRKLLREMSRHNCLNCHAAIDKLIGPSFELIAKRYANQTNQVELLATKLRQGSTGVWGEEKMPAQPDLALVKAREMVQWILAFDSKTNYNFSVGVEGSFKTKEKQDSGIYFLTASYLDRGLKDIPGSSKEGLHSIVLAAD